MMRLWQMIKKRWRVAFIAIATTSIGCLLATQFPLLIGENKPGSIYLRRSGKWQIVARKTDSSGLHAWRIKSWAPFGKKRLMVAVHVGWVFYIISKQPRAAELIQRLQSQNEKEIVGALMCLKRIPTADARLPLRRLLHSESPVIRVLASQVLWEIDDSSGIAQLQLDAKSTDTWISDLARSVLSSLQ